MKNSHFGVFSSIVVNVLDVNDAAGQTGGSGFFGVDLRAFGIDQDEGLVNDVEASRVVLGGPMFRLGDVHLPEVGQKFNGSVKGRVETAAEDGQVGVRRALETQGAQRLGHARNEVAVLVIQDAVHQAESLDGMFTYFNVGDFLISCVQFLFLPQDFYS